MIANVLNDRVLVIMIVFGVIALMGLYLAFFGEVEEEKPVKNKHKKV